MRTFISIDFPKEILIEIEKIQNKLPFFIGKKTELENLHLTLKFLGEIDEKKTGLIKDKLREIKFKKFRAEIDEIGVFSKNFIRIIWLHLTNCEELQKEIDNKLKDFFQPEKRFMSHITIARVKKIEDKKRFLEELKKIKIKKMSFDIGCFKLKKSILTSDKPFYEALENYSLN